MPFGPGVCINSFNGYGIISFFALIVLVSLIIILLVYLKQSVNDNQKVREDLLKIEKDLKELKELVKELKRKWEEIE